MPNKLAPSSQEFRAMAGAAVDFLASYFESLDSRPVLVPTTSRAIRERIDEPLPQTGAEVPANLATGVTRPSEPISKPQGSQGPGAFLG